MSGETTMVVPKAGRTYTTAPPETMKSRAEAGEDWKEWDIEVQKLDEASHTFADWGAYLSYEKDGIIDPTIDKCTAIYSVVLALRSGRKLPPIWEALRDIQKELEEWLKMEHINTKFRWVERGRWVRVFSIRFQKGWDPRTVAEKTATGGTEKAVIKGIATEVGVEAGIDGGLTGVTAKVSASISASLDVETRVTESSTFKYGVPSFKAIKDGRFMAWQRVSEFVLQKTEVDKTNPQDFPIDKAKWEDISKITNRAETVYPEVWPLQA